MPFRRIFKKTRRYDVSSKNSYVVGVHMLDNAFLECSLSSNSLGRECIESITQKYDIVEADYFGLRYVTKKLQFRWVDLDRPLKKQLDKFAQSPRLHFGVMYYTPSAHEIQDDNARYQYFLQLKNDIIDGRLPCSIEQAKRFAAYSLQAEFGDHIADQHIPEALIQYPILPTTLTSDQTTLLEILKDVLAIHQTLIGVHPVTAEIQYIRGIQRLDGYGMEYYVAKTSSSKELYLGTSFAGISRTYLDGQTSTTEKWSEITGVTHSKRIVSISSESNNKGHHYQLEDPDTAKYLCAMCLLQRSFYNSYKVPLSVTNSDSSADGDLLPPPPEELPDIQLSTQVTKDLPDVTDSHSSVYYTTEDSSLSGSGDFKHSVSQEYLTSQHSLDVLPNDGHPYTSEHQTHPNPGDQVQYDPQQQFADNSNEQYALQQHQQHQQQQQQLMDAQRRQALLPAYRPTPDYDAVMQQRLIQHQMTSMVDPNAPAYNIGPSHLYAYPNLVGFSQPEIYSSQPLDYHPGNSVYSAAAHRIDGLYGGHQGHQNQVIHATYSTPDLFSQIEHNHVSLSPKYDAVDAPYYTKPPPPYPRATSNSTPDLAGQTRAAITNSPDLVSRKNLGFHHANEVRNDPAVNVTISHPDVTILNVSRRDNAGKSPSDCSSETGDHGDGEPLDETADEVKSVQIKYVSPSDAPPQSKSAHIAIRRESFRRQMIANAPLMEARTKERESFTLATIPDVSTPPVTDDVGDTPPELPPKERKRANRYQRVSPATSQNSSPSPSRKSPSKKSPLRSSGLSPSKLLVTDIDTYTDEMRDMVLSNAAVDASLFGRSVSLRTYERPANARIRTSTRSNQSQNDRVRALRRCNPGVGGLRSSQRSDPQPSSCSASQLTSENSASESYASARDTSSLGTERDNFSDLSLRSDRDDEISFKRLSMGPLQVAALNGLQFSSPSLREAMTEDIRAPKDDRRKALENVLAGGVIFTEFEEIPRKYADYDTSTASLPENECRNRFRDVLPYECNRVKLTPRYDNDTGYINASHIKVSHGGEQWWFIASQAPMAISTEDFWQMVWEYNVHTVAMLTDIVEHDKFKCSQYWPEDTGEEFCLDLENFDVVLQYRSDSLYYVTNTIILRYKPLNKQRQIWHLQYTAWPDHGCPDDIFGFLGFLDEVESVQRLAESESDSQKKFPIVVHCTAGVGRTGVVILTEIMKSCLELNQSINLPKALTVLRQQRMFMVQTVGQYSFVYRTLVQYLKNSRLI